MAHIILLNDRGIDFWRKIYQYPGNLDFTNTARLKKMYHFIETELIKGEAPYLASSPNGYKKMIDLIKSLGTSWECRMDIFLSHKMFTGEMAGLVKSKMKKYRVLILMADPLEILDFIPLAAKTELGMDIRNIDLNYLASPSTGTWINLEKGAISVL